MTSRLNTPESKMHLRAISLENRSSHLFKTLSQMRTTTDLASVKPKDPPANCRDRKPGLLLTEICSGEKTGRRSPKPRTAEVKSRVKELCSTPPRYVFSKGPPARPVSNDSSQLVKVFRQVHRRYRVVRGEQRSLHDFYSSLFRHPTRRLQKTACQFSD